MSEEMKQSFPNSTCPYCGMNMKSGDGSWWCTNKTCPINWREGTAQTGEAFHEVRCVHSVRPLSVTALSLSAHMASRADGAERFVAMIARYIIESNPTELYPFRSDEGVE